MISITVRHRPDQYQHSAGIQVPPKNNSNQRQIMMAASESQTKIMQHKFNTDYFYTTSTNQMSSNVEVQYMAKYRPAQVNFQQRSAPVRLNDSPSDTPIKHYLDANNNHQLVDETADETGEAQEHDNLDSRAVGHKLEQAREQQHQHLHSRSISLVINPQFCASNSDSSGPLCRRRSMPRLRRARLQLSEIRPANQKRDEQTSSSSCVTANFTCSTDLQEELIENRCETNPAGAKLANEEDNNESLELSCSVSSNPHLSSRSISPRPALLRNPSHPPVRMSADDLNLFRQTGALLREISDEFSK